MYQHVSGESQEEDGGASAWDSAPVDHLQSAPQQPPKPSEEAVEETEEAMDTTQLASTEVSCSIFELLSMFASYIVSYLCIP